MPNSGIDKRAIAKLMRDMQREFDKHPIRIPMQADDVEAPSVMGGTAVYNGPVILGDANGAVITWDGGTANQVHNQTDTRVTPGYEAIAQAVASTLQGLPAVGLAAEDEQDAQAAGEEVLAEVVAPEPDHGKVRRLLSVIKGYLSPVAAGIAEGAGDGAQEWTKTAIEQLGTPF